MQTWLMLERIGGRKQNYWFKSTYLFLPQSYSSCFSIFIGLSVVCDKKKTFKQGAACLKNVQITLNSGNIPFLRRINRVSPSICKIISLMRKTTILAHPDKHLLNITAVNSALKRFDSRKEGCSMNVIVT